MHEFDCRSKIFGWVSEATKDSNLPFSRRMFWDHQTNVDTLSSNQTIKRWRWRRRARRRWTRDDEQNGKRWVECLLDNMVCVGKLLVFRHMEAQIRGASSRAKELVRSLCVHIYIVATYSLLYHYCPCDIIVYVVLYLFHVCSVLQRPREGLI